VGRLTNKFSPNELNRLMSFYHRMVDPAATEAEAGKAMKRINEMLKRAGLGHHDLMNILHEVRQEGIDADKAAAEETRAKGWDKGPDGTDLGIPGNDLIGLMLAVSEDYVWVTDEERLADMLWILHSYHFRTFSHTPRLLAISPIENSGKSTLMKLVAVLGHKGKYWPDATAAAVYRQLDDTPGITLALDEWDNLDLGKDANMRKIFNNGFETFDDAPASKVISGQVREFKVAAPLACGAIRELPRPLMSRSIINKMRKAPKKVRLKRFNKEDPAFKVLRDAIWKWTARCNLNPDPEMPEAVYGRNADKWRSLISIADDLGYGEKARAAAVKLCSDRQCENPYVTLLIDIKTVFDAYSTDRLNTRAELIPALIGLEGSLYNEWTGPNGTGKPHRLTPGDLGYMLGNKTFGITSKNIWPSPRMPDSKCFSGYRWQFEEVWSSWCSEDDQPDDTDSTATPPQGSNIKYLRKP
jgi:hypothetical protein